MRQSADGLIDRLCGWDGRVRPTYLWVMGWPHTYVTPSTDKGGRYAHHHHAPAPHSNQRKRTTIPNAFQFRSLLVTFVFPAHLSTPGWIPIGQSRSQTTHHRPATALSTNASSGARPGPSGDSGADAAETAAKESCVMRLFGWSAVLFGMTRPVHRGHFL